MSRRAQIHRNSNNTRKKSAQSTIEYVILLSGVIVVFLLFMGNNGFFRGALQDTLQDLAGTMNRMSNVVVGTVGTEEP